MQLTMREQEKMMISLAAMIAQRRKDKGIKLNHPEAVALITDYVLEGAREGKTVAQLMDEARNLCSALWCKLMKADFKPENENSKWSSLIMARGKS